MPTTAVGLLIFVVLLAPGLTYSAYRSASKPVIKVTALRELGGIALRSAVCDVAAIIAFGAFRGLFPNITPDVGALVRAPAEYLRHHYVSTAWWALGTLVFACALALAAALVAGSDRASRARATAPFSWFAPRGRVVQQSAWWMLFNEFPDAQVYVGATLDDGTYIGGWLLSYSPDSDETEDRELTLGQPISFRSPEATSEVSLDVGAVSLSARRLQYLTVSYVEESAADPVSAHPPRENSAPESDPPAGTGDARGG